MGRNRSLGNNDSSCRSSFTHKTSLSSPAILAIITSTWIHLVRPYQASVGSNILRDKNVEDDDHFNLIDFTWLCESVNLPELVTAAKQASPESTSWKVRLGWHLVLSSAAAILGSTGKVNVYRWPSRSASGCLAGSFAIQICGARLSKCFPCCPATAVPQGSVSCVCTLLFMLLKVYYRVLQERSQTSLIPFIVPH